MEFSDDEDMKYIHGGTDTHGGINMRGTGRKSVTTGIKPMARARGGNTLSASSSKLTSNTTQESATGIGSEKTRSEILREETIDESVGKVDKKSNSDKDNNANAANGTELYGAK